MFSCKDITEKANEYIDRELPLFTRAKVQLHLFICVNCRQYLRQLQLTIHTLRKMPGHSVETPSQDKVSDIVSILQKETAPDKTPSGDKT